MNGKISLKVNIKNMRKEKKSIVVKCYNINRWLYLHKMKFLAKINYHLMQIVFGCTIPPACNLAKGVDFPHFHGIVINEHVIVGENTKIYQNVTLGGTHGQCNISIGKNCFIGAGAVILGNIVIGDNVKIGANAVVLNDIPSNSTAVGVPAKIVKRGL